MFKVMNSVIVFFKNHSKIKGLYSKQQEQHYQKEVKKKNNGILQDK